MRRRHHSRKNVFDCVPTEIGTDYKKVILSFEDYVRSNKTWDSGGPVDMHIGAVNKEKASPIQREVTNVTRAKTNAKAKQAKSPNTTII